MLNWFLYSIFTKKSLTLSSQFFLHSCLMFTHCIKFRNIPMLVNNNHLQTTFSFLCFGVMFTFILSIYICLSITDRQLPSCFLLFSNYLLLRKCEDVVIWFLYKMTCLVFCWCLTSHSNWISIIFYALSVTLTMCLCIIVSPNHKSALFLAFCQNQACVAGCES